MMEKIMVILKKELRAYFNSPTAYIVILVFLLISGYLFSFQLFIINEVTIAHFLRFVPLLLIFFIPAITMNLISEEHKTGTFEVLATLPIREWDILIGKFLAAFFLVSATILSTLFYPILLQTFARLDWGRIAGSYLGLLLMSASFISMGFFSSTLTKNQIVAFILGFLICFSYYLLGKSTDFVPAPLAALIDFVGLDSHFDNISKGLIDSRDLVYFASIIVIFLYLSFANLIRKR